MDTKETTPTDDPLKAVQERFAPQFQQAQERLVGLNDKVKAFVRENPGTTLLGALALGFVIGKLASRK